jgi:hypothetical protein
MNTTSSVKRDERTVAVENTSYKWAYILITYALLIDVIYRGIVHKEAAWDLLALVIAGGAVCTVFQARQKILAHGWVRDVMLVALIGAVIAGITMAIILSFDGLSFFNPGQTVSSP